MAQLTPEAKKEFITRRNTTILNILRLLKELGLPDQELENYIKTNKIGKTLKKAYQEYYCIDKLYEDLQDNHSPTKSPRKDPHKKKDSQKTGLFLFTEYELK